MDRAYLDFLVRWEKLDSWSFFDLTGCPGDLFVFLLQLAEIARESEIALSMKWLNFDISPVVEIQEKLTNWTYNSDCPLNEDASGLERIEELESQLHESRDRYHCADSWRIALLLYIETVFQRNEGRNLLYSKRLARTILDHVKCCRRTSQTQKQLLLPAFLAGCETSDPEMRLLIKDYCGYWADKSGYKMFESVPLLLDEIWRTGKWWGEVVDKNTGSQSPGQNRGGQRVLLG